MCNTMRICVVAKVSDPGQSYFRYRASIHTFGPDLFFCKINLGTYTEIKSISIPHQISGHFRPAHKTQVNSDHPHQKQGQVRPPTQKRRLDLHTKSDVIPAENKKSCQFRPSTQKAGPFRPHTKTDSFSPRTQNPCQFQPFTQKPSQV